MVEISFSFNLNFLSVQILLKNAETLIRHRADASEDQSKVWFLSFTWVLHEISTELELNWYQIWKGRLSPDNIESAFAAAMISFRVVFALL